MRGHDPADISFNCEPFQMVRGGVFHLTKVQW